jgi:hypothetical protein
MIFASEVWPNARLHKSEIIVSVAGIFITHERGFQVFRGRFVFTASIKGQTECDVRRSETRIAFQSFEVSLSRVTFFTLFVERESFDVALLRARRILRIGNRSRGGLKSGLLSTGESVRYRSSTRHPCS